MNAHKTWFSAAELADMKLAGIPASKKGVIDFASRVGWQSRKREGRGGGMEYQPPKAILQLINHKTMTAMISTNSANAAINPSQTPNSHKIINRTIGAPTITIGGLTRHVKTEQDLTHKDRASRDAALILCRAVEEVMSVAGCSASRAINELASRIMSGVAHSELVDAANASYTKPRAHGQTQAALVSRLQKMHAAYRQGTIAGNGGLYLVPSRRQKEQYAPYLIQAFLSHYCRPNRPPVMEAWKLSAPWFAQHGFDRPSVDTFYRIEKTLPVTVKYRGRVTGSAWRSIMPYVKRDVSMFKANDIWVGDGHSFKAKVQNAVHGRPYVPEITFIRDWVSRRIVGWSIDLAESCIAVSAALSHAMLMTKARPLVYYSDNGSGQTAKQLDHPVTGTLANLGIAHETGIPGNPQGRGIIERLWADTLIPLARSYPTYQGKGGDSESIRKMLVDLNRKAPKTLLPSFKQLVADVEAVVNEYNNRPHGALGKQTPNEVYAQKLDQDSLEIGLTESELATLWMPMQERTPARGLITLFNNEYAMPQLLNMLAEGEKVHVRFDIHNADKVWIFKLDGRYLGEAIWDGHKRAAFPEARIDQLKEARVERFVAKAEREIKQKREELGQVIEGEKLTQFVFPDAPEPVKLKAFVFPDAPSKAAPTMADTRTILRLLEEKKQRDDDAKNEKAA